MLSNYLCSIETDLKITLARKLPIYARLRSRKTISFPTAKNDERFLEYFSRKQRGFKACTKYLVFLGF